MDDPALAIQKALIAHLLAQSEIAGLVSDRVFDDPGDNATLPYIRIGRIDVGPLRTDGATDWDLMVTIEVHSRDAGGRVEATRIAGGVVRAVDGCEAVVSVPDYPLEWCQFEAQDVARANDGRSYVATVAFAVSLSGA